jgi:hypothetical protein
MNTVGGICKHVSEQLNDQTLNREYGRWTRPMLLEYLNQSRKEIAAYRPEAFSTKATIPLVPGTKQKATGYVDVKNVTQGNIPVPQADAEILKAFAGYDYCPPKLQFKNGNPVYNVRSFAVDKQDNSVFYVSPPVPAGIAVSVEVYAVGQVDDLTLADWDKNVLIASKYYNNLLDFMFARAFELDTESAVSASKSNSMFQRFYQAMGVKYKIDAALRSGFYKGETGTGDLRAVIR